MQVRVIKEYVKHNRIHKVGAVLGVTKPLALHLIKKGLVEDVNDTLKLKKSKPANVVKPKKVASKKAKKSKK